MALVSVALTGWVVVREAGSGLGAGGAVASSAGSGDDERSGPERARAVLREWDARRAAAWASGSLRGLRGLYVDGSPAGRADARMLASYVDRGLVVRGLRTQVLALRVLGSSAGRLRLRVTDRLVGGEAVTRDGREVRLPVDRATVREVEMRRVAGEWRVLSVRDAR